jgi:hypothetical protein
MLAITAGGLTIDAGGLTVTLVVTSVTSGAEILGGLTVTDVGKPLLVD